ncbi:MAG: DUF2142 domain-containing protein [Lachnospiraceae bacterium]|nr:DUF2142 domain-containing protein [Lachnospiraceae bacterium]
MKKYKAKKNSSVIRLVVGALLINLLLLLMMVILLGERPVDQLKEYCISRQKFEQEAEVYGGIKFRHSFICTGREDCFELHVDSKDYIGSYEVSLLNVSGESLKSWTTDKMRILDTKQGKDRWIFYEAGAELLTEGNEYCIEVSAPRSDAESSVFVSGFSTYRKERNYFAVIALVLLFITANIWWFSLEKPVEKWSVWILLGTGLIMFFIMSPSSQTDENTHYYSAFKVSNLMLGRENLNEIEGDYNAGLKQHFNSNESFMKLIQNIWPPVQEDREDTFIERNTFSFVQPVAYLASGIGITIGRLFGLNYYLTYSLARLLNLLLYVVLVWLAIRLMPRNKELILMVGIMPMAMHQAASLSYDMTVNGLSFVFFAYILRLIDEKKNFGWKNALICACILGTLGPVKVVYCALFLLLFMIPSKQFEGLKGRLIMCIPVIIFAVAILGLTRLPDIVGRVDGSTFGEANPYYDMNYIMTQPGAFLQLLIKTVKQHAGLFLMQAVGYSLAGTTVSISDTYIKAYLVMLVLNQLFQEKTSVPGIRQRVVALATSACIIAGILITMTLSYTRYGRNIIDGIQGRYFIPVMVPVLYSFSVGRIPLKVNRKYFTGIAWFAYLGVIIEVMSRITY